MCRFFAELTSKLTFNKVLPLQVVTGVSSASTQFDLSSIVPPPQDALH